MKDTRIVVDTNVVLDLLVFAEPSTEALGDALAGGQLRALACDRMLDELRTVLERGLAQARGADAQAVVDLWSARVDRVAAPASGWALRCTDGDDQVFVDLALEHRVRWLVTRDRAVLRLSRRALRHGLAIVTPQAWRTEWAARAESGTGEAFGG